MKDEALDKLSRTAKCVYCGAEDLFPSKLVSYIKTPYECANCRAKSKWLKELRGEK